MELTVINDFHNWISQTPFDPRLDTLITLLQVLLTSSSTLLYFNFKLGYSFTAVLLFKNSFSTSGLYVENLRHEEVQSRHDVFVLLQKGKELLVTAETNMVRHSSRFVVILLVSYKIFLKFFCNARGKFVLEKI